MLFEFSRFFFIVKTFSKLFVYFLFTGMSQIAALLLMYLVEEEDAFWGLHNLMVNTYTHFHIKMEHFKENGNEFFRYIQPMLCMDFSSMDFPN